MILSLASSTGATAAQPHNIEAVSKTAQAITVRVEGATQGSGVLVQREGNRYTVLTAWHVLAGQNPGEELYVETPDHRKYLVDLNRVVRLPGIDAAQFTFISDRDYKIAKVRSFNTSDTDQHLAVSGFPSLGGGGFKLVLAPLLANASSNFPDCSQIYYYTDETRTGMSGGGIFSLQGELLGIHALGRPDELKTRQNNFLVKAKIGSGISLSCLQDSARTTSTSRTITPVTPDDYFVTIDRMPKDAKYNEVIQLASKGLALSTRAATRGFLYIWRGNSKQSMGDLNGAIEDFENALAIFGGRDPQLLYNIGNAESLRGEYARAINAYDQALTSDPSFASAYLNQGNAFASLGRFNDAILRYNQAIRLNPTMTEAIQNRGAMKLNMGDDTAAESDFKAVIHIDPLSKDAAIAHYNLGKILYHNNDSIGAIREFSAAVSIDPGYTDPLAARGVVKNRLGDKGGACIDFLDSANLGNAAGKRLALKHCN